MLAILAKNHWSWSKAFGAYVFSCEIFIWNVGMCTCKMVKVFCREFCRIIWALTFLKAFKRFSFDLSVEVTCNLKWPIPQHGATSNQITSLFKIILFVSLSSVTQKFDQTSSNAFSSVFALNWNIWINCHIW